MKRTELQQAKIKMKADIEALKKRLEETENPGMRRQIKIQIAILQEKLADANEDLVHENKLEKAQKAAKRTEHVLQEEESYKSQLQQETEEVLAFDRFIKRLQSENKLPEGPQLSLADLGKYYRREAERIRHKIHEVEERPVSDFASRVDKEEKLRILKAMQRDMAEVALECETYYDHRSRKWGKGGHRNLRLTTFGIGRRG